MVQKAAKLKNALAVTLILLLLPSGIFIVRGYLAGQGTLGSPYICCSVCSRENIDTSKC